MPPSRCLGVIKAVVSSCSGTVKWFSFFVIPVASAKVRRSRALVQRPVQNPAYFRPTKTFLKPIWNRTCIDCVQTIMAENMTSTEIIFLIDVDNTLLDNDRFGSDLSAFLDQSFGADERRRYWSIFETLREQHGYADYLGALQNFRLQSDNLPVLLTVPAFLLDYPFSTRLYPRAIAVIEHLRTMGPVVILSDGDIVFQPRKIKRAGLWDAVEAQVLVYLHKELSLDDVQWRFPAAHYVAIDDKPRLLAAMKRVLMDRLTTVFVRQGHYAIDQERNSTGPPPDLTVDRIGDLCEFRMDRFHTYKPSRDPPPGNRDKEVP